MKTNHRGAYNYNVTLDYWIASILMIVIGSFFTAILFKNYANFNKLELFLIGSFAVSFVVVGSHCFMSLWSQWQNMRYARRRSGVEA